MIDAVLVRRGKTVAKAIAENGKEQMQPHALELSYMAREMVHSCAMQWTDGRSRSRFNVFMIYCY